MHQHVGVSKAMYDHWSLAVLMLVRPLGHSDAQSRKTCGSSSSPVWSVILASVVTCKYIQHAFNFTSLWVGKSWSAKSLNNNHWYKRGKSVHDAYLTCSLFTLIVACGWESQWSGIHGHGWVSMRT